MRNPKRKSISPDDEQLLGKAEGLHMRADIIAAGVAAQLTRSEYGHDLLTECAGLLGYAAGLHKEAFAIQSTIKLDYEIPGPYRRRRKRPPTMRASAGRKPGAAANKKKGAK